MNWIALRMLTGDLGAGFAHGGLRDLDVERVSDLDAKALIVLGDVDERDIALFRRGAPARPYPRGETTLELTMQFARVESFVVPKTSLTGDNTERVDTRVLQVLYAIEPSEHSVYVGQQLDVFIDGANADAIDEPATHVAMEE